MLRLQVRCQPQSLPPASAQQAPRCASRRAVLLALPGAGALLAVGAPAAVAVPPPGENAGGVDSATSPLVQELLRRSKENKVARDRERLDDYYRRNFNDYFSFEAGNPNGLSPETQQRIKEWLERNGDKALPFQRVAAQE